MREKTNEIKRIIEFFDRLEKEAQRSASLDKSLLYKKSFLVTEEMDEKVLFELKIDYVKMLEGAIDKLKGVEWDSEKLIDVLKAIQDDIIKLKLKCNDSEFDAIRNSCKMHKVQLELIERVYDNFFGEEKITDSKIADLQNKISEIIQELEEAAFDKEFKVAIKQQLYSIQLVLNKYRIFGKQAIEKETQTLLGQIMMESGNINGATPEERSFLRKILGFITNANGILKFVENIGTYAPPLLEELKKIVR